MNTYLIRFNHLHVVLWLLGLWAIQGVGVAATLNVLNYGASGTGSSDDTLPIQAALDACASGDTVYLPAGTYSVKTLYLRVGCNVAGDRARTTLKARATGQSALLYATDENRNSTIENLIFDMNQMADTGVKFDWEVKGGIIRYNVFQNGGSPGAIFLPSGTQKSDRNTSIDHNIFKNIGQGVFSYNKLNNTNVDWNHYDTFEQGVSAGGCSDAFTGDNTTIDHNTFLLGRRMAIEVCGKWNNLSASYNYIASWRPSLTPQSENYTACSGSYPYMCDSMAISLAIGGYGVTASHNRIYRQPGTSWGIEYTVMQPPVSKAEGNIIKNAGIAIFDDACSYMGAGNCAATRAYINSNFGCGGNATANTDIFNTFPSTNFYYASCSHPSFPPEEPVPAMPFSVTSGGGTAPNQAPQVSLMAPSSGAILNAGTTIVVSASASDPDGTVTKVEFYRNGALAATANVAPYSYSWSNAAEGSYTLMARATDNSGATTSTASVSVSVLTASTSPILPSVTPGALFYKGINLFGPAVTIDGNAWLSYTSALADGLTVLNANTWAGSYGFTPVPTADASTRSVLESALWRSNAANGEGFSMQLRVPNGKYDVYVWAIENYASNYRNFDLKLEGVTAAQRIGDLALGEWRKYGPYTVTVGDGVLNMDVLRSTKGDPALMGIALFFPGDTQSNQSPQATVLSPVNGTMLAAGTTVSMTASASDPDGSISRVEFYRDGSLVGTTTSAPFTHSWKEMGIGSHTLHARATDNKGAAAASNAVQITVVAPNQPPVVTLTPPSANTMLTAPATIVLTATASDPDGSIAKVEFVQGSTVIGTVGTAPYSFTWSNVAAGTYSLTARATDNLGAVTISAAVSASVAAANGSTFYKGINLGGPAVAIEGNAWLSHDSARASGLTVANALLWAGSFGGNVMPAADAGTRAMLESAVWRSGDIPGQGFTLQQTLPNGTYQLYAWVMENYIANYRSFDIKLEGVTVAQAIGDLGLGGWRKYGPYTATVSDGALTIDVLRGSKGNPALMGIALYSVTGAAKPNQAPQVALTSPVGGTRFNAGSTVTMTAAASDSDGSVSKIEFLRNGTVIATSNAAPYTCSWSNAAAGSYTLQARATDNNGAITSSSAVTISVAAVNQPPVVGLTSPVAGASLNAPASIVITANANDTDGSIAKVEFLQGATVLATDTAPPFTYTWSNVAGGNYVLTARAIDNTGAVSTSAPVSIKVVGAPVFYRGINLNGAAVTIEGNGWLSHSSALASGLTAQNANTWAGSYSFTLSPAADTATRSVLQSMLWRSTDTPGEGFSLRQSLPNGSYQLYVWVVENYVSNSRSFDLKLEGVKVATAIGDMPLGQWKKLGPYPATVSDGALDIEAIRGSKGQPSISGIAIYSVPGGTN